MSESQEKFTSVPFKTDDNFTAVSGMAKFSRAGIVLEYEGRIFGIIKSGVKEARIASEEILDVRFKKGILKLGAKIEIRLKNFGKLTELPNRDGKVTLKIERADFDRAFEAVERLNRVLGEPNESLPPVRTPVGSLFEDSDDGFSND